MDTQLEFIERKRAEISSSCLAEAGHHMTARDVLDDVYEDDNDDDFEKYVIRLAGDNWENVEQAQELCMELFNYFPRQTLGGKSLAEKMTFDELKEMENAWQNFKNGTGGSYGYNLEAGR